MSKLLADNVSAPGIPACQEKLAAAGGVLLGKECRPGKFAPWAVRRGTYCSRRRATRGIALALPAGSSSGPPPPAGPRAGLSAARERLGSDTGRLDPRAGPPALREIAGLKPTYGLVSRPRRHSDTALGP